MLTFVVILSRTERPIFGGLLAHVSRFERRELSFIADQHLKWHSKNRRISVNAWQAFTEQGQIGSHWHIGENRVTLVGGVPYDPESPWEAGVSRAQQLANRIDAFGFDVTTETLRGAFSLLDVHEAGGGIVISDRQSALPLYQHVSDDLVIISNRASLVGRLVLREEDEAVLDWRGPAANVFAGIPIGTDTGFDRVSMVPRQTGWIFGPDTTPEPFSREPFGAAGGPEPAELPDVQIEQILRKGLRAAAALPYQRHRLILDGSLASRLLLGLADSEGLLDRIALATYGDPTEPGVRTAIELAEKTRRPIQVVPRMVSDPIEFERQARLHTFQTNGVGSLWELRGDLAARNLLSIEPLASGLVAPDARARRLLGELLEPSGTPLFDPHSLLNPAVSAHIDALVGAELMQPDGLVSFASGPGSVWSFADAADAARVFPFLDPEIWSIATSLDFEEISEASPAHSILRRVAPELLDLPIDDDLNEADPRIRAFPALFPIFDQILLEPFNPILDIVNLAVLPEALIETQSDPTLIRALYDLLTVGMWLGDYELRQRIHRADEIGVWGDFSPLDYQTPSLVGDAAAIPGPDVSVRNPKTDLLLDAELKIAEPGPTLAEDARILGVIPHFKAGEYLRQAIESLLQQSRPLQGIVVIDDHSPTSPEPIVASYPGVTLLRAQERSGPYRLLQTLFEHVDYDAILFQDADDWSVPYRLETLLDQAVRTGQEHIGSQCYRVYIETREATPLFHPFDAAEVQRQNPTSKTIIHGTSLLSTDLIERAGGFSPGLLFGGDTEFLRRASRIGRIGNSREFLYFYRIHSSSLTGSDDTGMHTALRQSMLDLQKKRSVWNAERVAAGLAPVLAPMAVTTRAQLDYVCGAALAGKGGAAWPPSADSSARYRPIPIRKATRPELDSTPRPVFLIGARNSGTSFIGIAIAQLDNFMLLVGTDWITRLALSLRAIHMASSESRKRDELVIGEISPDAFAAHFGHSVNTLLLQGVEASIPEVSGISSLGHHSQLNRQGATRFIAEGNSVTRNALAFHSMFPESRFVHILRDPDESVHSPGTSSRNRTQRFDENRAYDHWMQDVQSALMLEAALGSDVVLRVDHSELMGNPECGLREIFEFIEEPWDARVLRPFL